jgi:hypothetical protein
MTWVTENRKHQLVADRCPIVDAADNYHFELKCEDCDVKRMSTMSLDRVDELYREGRVTQDDFEAYLFVWTALSPYRPDVPVAPLDPHVRRIARKLLIIRGFDVPASIND